MILWKKYVGSKNCQYHIKGNLREQGTMCLVPNYIESSIILR